MGSGKGVSRGPANCLRPYCPDRLRPRGLLSDTRLCPPSPESHRPPWASRAGADFWSLQMVDVEQLNSKTRLLLVPGKFDLGREEDW